MYEVSDQFLTATIDAGNVRDNWEVINFIAPRVINMAKALAPAILASYPGGLGTRLGYEATAILAHGQKAHLLKIAA